MELAHKVMERYRGDGLAAVFGALLRAVTGRMHTARLAAMKRLSPLSYSAAMRARGQYGATLAALVAGQADAIRARSAGAGAPLLVDCGVNEAVVLERYVAALPGFAFAGFEAQSKLIPVARARVPGARIQHAAVSDRDGEAAFYLSKGFEVNFRGGSTLVQGAMEPGAVHAVETVRTIRFVDWLRHERQESGHDFVAVKMDVEGAEYPILDDLFAHWEATGERLVDYLMIEFHPGALPQGTTERHYLDRLAAMGLEHSTWI
jgi:FkbM family methyltransferase